MYSAEYTELFICYLQTNAGEIGLLRWCWLCDENLHAAVLGAVGWRVVGNQGFVRAAAVNGEAVGGDAARGEVVAGIGCAVHGQWVVDGIGAGVVGVADDGD